MLYRRMGWRVTSATSFGSFRSSRKFFPRAFLYSMYSGKCRPACRKSHTGVRSTFWPLAARIMMSFAGAELWDARTPHLIVGELAERHRIGGRWVRCWGTVRVSPKHRAYRFVPTPRKRRLLAQASWVGLNVKQVVCEFAKKFVVIILRFTTGVRCAGSTQRRSNFEEFLPQGRERTYKCG